jgi:hypothetical protein
MAYQLRFESNAFRADSAIGRLVDVLGAFGRGARRAVGIRVEEYQGNEIRQLRGINQRTFDLAMDWADNDFDEQMQAIKWDWKGQDVVTRRKNGEKVTEPRNIIDEGDLLASKRRDEIRRGVTEFIWEDDVAELVHDGGTTKNDTAYPARPWTEPTLDNIDGVIETVLRNGGR